MIDENTGELKGELLAIQSHSTDIGALAGALAKAQGTMPTATATKAAVIGRDSTRRYAGLDDVWDACRKPLADNGLAVIQLLSGGPDRLTISTVLAHESGQWLRSEMTMAVSANPSQNSAQAMGSAISYARRYELAAIVGIAVGADDDDGEKAASGRTAPVAKAEPPKPSAVRMTAEQRARIGELGVALNLGEKAMQAWLAERGIQTPLTPETALAAIAALEAAAEPADSIEV